MKRSYLVLNEEKRKQGNKKEKLTESLHLTVKIARKLNDNQTLVSETSHKQNHCGNHKAALNEKPTDSPQWFFIRSSNSVSKTSRAIFLFTIKIIEMFELHASMPPMRSAEYQATIPLKFIIIVHNNANV